MAVVIHPVDRPLQSNVDANGKLVEKTGEMVVYPAETTPLSACTVGHLAQHSFCRLLYEAEAPLATVEYDMPVVRVDSGVDGLHRVQTKDGTTYTAPVVVAADGAHSTLRKLWNIPMDGQEAIQHLVNVHIKASSKVPPAMLYSIWNPKLVGMMVCHSRGEYVLQIPYFFPYQTIERNFAPAKVRTMVEAAFGGDSRDISVESIRPWTMSSLIARHYVNDKGCVLVGDAAHVFPPAGGFGMNTGLQDVHNLAWRLSLWHKNPSSEKLSSTLSKYERERRPVAQRNAALSVRNYRRILNLTRACYLNDQHPVVLIQLLDQMSFVPLRTRQIMFQSLLETAMWPLSTLQNPSNIHARHVTNNVRHILRQGGGLPLLFPKFELGFGYGDNDTSSADREDWTQDSMGYTPEVKVGHLLPHVELEVLNDCEETCHNLQPLQDTETEKIMVTSNDLPSQLRVGSPCFALLVLNASDNSSEMIRNAVKAIKAECGMEIRLVQVVAPNKQPSATLTYDLIVREVDSKLSSMMERTEVPILILIRPDGHVASVVFIQNNNTKDGRDEPERASSSNVGQVLLQALERAM
jgi:2-polyprenyl-6-methoxyphenol hydroxylase-like FAD-dependent oxidoreductase